MWFIGVEVEQETSASPPKKNPGSAPEHREIFTNSGSFKVGIFGRKWITVQFLPLIYI